MKLPIGDATPSMSLLTLPRPAARNIASSIRSRHGWHKRKRLSAWKHSIAALHTRALVVTASAWTPVHLERIVALAAKLRLPAVCPRRLYVDSGCLISYRFDMVDQFRRAAGYVDRILKGEKPADLPVPAPARSELVVNLKTAKALGLTCRTRCSRAPTR